MANPYPVEVETGNVERLIGEMTFTDPANQPGSATTERAIYTGRISPAQAKRVDEMQAVADALSLLANIVMAWNTSQMQAVLDRWSNRRQAIPPELIGKIAPTRLESINLRGVFRFPVDRYADQILPSRQGAPITGTNG